MDNYDNFFDNPKEPDKEKTPIYHTEGHNHSPKSNVPMIICIVVAVVMTLLVIVNVVLLASLKSSIADEYAAQISQQMQDQYAEAVKNALEDQNIVEDVTQSATQNALEALKTTVGEVASGYTASVARLYMYEGSTDSSPKGMATAFLITDATDSCPQRYLATNAHCVRYAATRRVGGGGFFGGTYEYEWASYGKIVAVFDGEKSTYPLEIVAYGGYNEDSLDAENDMPDLALLRVKGSQPSNEDHPALKLAASDYTPIGSPIALIGNPEGIGSGNSISTGCVSQTGIQIASWGSGKFILTDAALNSGNSGGPMIDRLGVVVGVAESKLVEESIDNMGFALSASTLFDFIKWASQSANNVQRADLTINCTYSYA